MCGIAGIWDSRASHNDAFRDRVQNMTDRLQHRGPDDQGIWCEHAERSQQVIGLGHRRLSVLDLSDAGRQPMTSHCGRFVVVFNGEIYNYRELRKQLDSHVSFRSDTDTEVLLAAILQWGIEETLPRLNGMFAFAVYDRDARRLTIARDRVGIKPLYYQHRAGRVAFASELKSLASAWESTPALDRFAVCELLRYGYIPAPRTIYDGVCKLQPGTWLQWSDADLQAAPPAPRHYWSLADHLAAGAEQRDSEPSQQRLEDACDHLRSLLVDSVRMRMVSDVPLGAFLSGGIDSSLVVSLMQHASNQQAKTFCIGFDEPEYDESPHAAKIAAHLGTDHTELIVTGADAREVIPQLADVWDEPFADSSQIPTLLVSQLARQHVTVSLSGDGGDELFGGYTRYSTFADRWQQLRIAPRFVRKGEAALLGGVAKLLPSPWSYKLRRRALCMNVHSPGELYAVHNSHWRDAEHIVRSEAHSPAELRPQWWQPPSGLSPIETWMATDLQHYLPDDILTKVDRASMRVGLEARVPLLDHRIVEWAWTLPLELKRETKKSKLPLRRLLAEHVPSKLFERPKMGFGIPIDKWLRGPLRDWADDLLATDRLERQQLLCPQRVSEVWDLHRSGKQDWQYLLWDVLMLQSWLDANDVGAPVP